MTPEELKTNVWEKVLDVIDSLPNKYRLWQDEYYIDKWELLKLLEREMEKENDTYEIDT